MPVDQREFSIFLKSINKCYSEHCRAILPTEDDFPTSLFDEFGILETEKLLHLSNNRDDILFKSVANRIVAISNIRDSRQVGSKLDVYSTWKLIKKSILLLPKDSTIASIGSQGFLSIPLYRKDEDIKNLDFIRLHLWSSQLTEHIDKHASENFSIHSHTFFAHSWIIYGQVVNDRFDIIMSDENTDLSLFIIQYNDSVKNINQHSSVAVNTDVSVKANQLSHEVYMQGSSYQIKAGDYHKSASLDADGLSATFFSFTAQDGLVNKSYVVGPKEIRSSEINRTFYTEAREIILQLDNKLTNHDR